MKVHKVVLLVVDTGNMGAEGIKEVVESDLYPNHCIGPRVMAVETRDVEWTSDHPFSCSATPRAEFDLLFPADGTGILHEISRSLVQSSTLPADGFRNDKDHLKHVITCMGRIRYLVHQAIGDGDIGEGTCFSGRPCRLVEGTVSCADCGFPRAYVNGASYSAGIEIGAVLLGGVPMRTITEPSEPVGVMTIVRRVSQGPDTADNVIRESYTLPGYPRPDGAA